MSEGELGIRIHQKVIDGNGKVSYAFGIRPIIEVCLKDLLDGSPELSPQTLRWLRRWFGFEVDTFEWQRQGCGVKLLTQTNHKEKMEKKP